MPASATPLASTTAMQPGGISSMAARVERGDAHEAGVARSSRAGTKRRVKAGPTTRGWPGRSGTVPRIQTRRRPFLSRTVVSVAVEMPASAVALSVMALFPSGSCAVRRRPFGGRASCRRSILAGPWRR
jgi:hypothetical protein